MSGRAPGLTVEVPAFGFGDGLLFENFAMTLEPGRWTCLLGASGCGKSTLLRLIAGLLDGATVRAQDGAPLAGRIALMAQSDGLLPWLGVADNVLLGPRLRGAAITAEDRARAGALLEQVGLGDVADAAPATLSGGMRQRVALARTLMEDRPVVLMDEPFTALDAITRHRLQDLVAELFAGRTVLLVTHSPLEALRLGHTIRVMGERPARLGAPIHPAGAVPRPAGDEAVLRQQGDLLGRLSAAAEGAVTVAP